jgi:phage tail-like protein
MIDVNGTRHHLILGRDDWMRAASEGPRLWEYNEGREVVQLQAEIYAFARRGKLAEALDVDARRGGARDSYGHWYWIEADEAGEPTRIMARWAQASEAEVLFPLPPELCPVPDDIFRPAAADEPAEPEPLAGLAVTTGGYLVAGSPTTGSLLVFDLYALDGGYVRVRLPALPDAPAELTVPFDLAALPDGGLLVLDTVHKLVWVLDHSFRPLPAGTTPKGDLLTFQPKRGSARREHTTPPVEPITLTETDHPVAIEPLPDGSFWILDTPSDDTLPSILWRYALDGRFAPQFIQLLTANLVDDDADDLDLQQIRGYDIAYLPDLDSRGNALSTGLLFVADISGTQAYGLRADVSGDLRLRIERRYYPLRSFSGVGLVGVWSAGEAYYHQGARWLPIKALPQMRYEEEARLILPALDGRDPGCVWHRLCLDACIPPETDVQVETRAAETEADLIWQPWIAQPRLYLRPAGSEIAYYTLWSDDDLFDEDTGTWEVLFQQTQGRYMQMRLTLVGNGRSTPALRALRAHYPRFSYLRAYLPAVYHQDPASMQFVENYLANPEGILTTLEGLIAQVQVFMDVRTVPADAVDWLANWLGLALEPGWSDYQRRLLIAHAPYFFLRRGTLPGVLQAIILAVYPQLGPDIFRDDINCTTIRVVERFLTRTQPGITAGDPTDPDLTITGDVLADAKARAHRFVVLLPTTLPDDTQRLVERIVELEKPAHTSFVVKQFWALFRVGEVRLGIDTVLGQGGRFELFRLGETALAEGILGAAYPETLTTRTVIAR